MAKVRNRKVLGKDTGSFMKALILGDVHAHWDLLVDISRRAFIDGCDVIFQVGDLGFGFGEIPDLTPIIPVYFADGNHENHRALNALHDTDEIVEIYSNIFHVIRGGVLELGGLSFLFAGGSFSIDRKYRVKNVSWWEDEVISESDAAKMLSHPCDSIDVVISHDCPFSVNISKFMVTNQISRDYLEKVYRYYSMSSWFFGHYHQRYYRFDIEKGTQFFCLPSIHDDGAIGLVFDFESKQIDKEFKIS